jgi:hypothetical protein
VVARWLVLDMVYSVSEARPCTLLRQRAGPLCPPSVEAAGASP